MPGGTPTEALRFTLAQFLNHRGGHLSTEITRNRYQELLTESRVNIMFSLGSKRPDNQWLN